MHTEIIKQPIESILHIAPVQTSQGSIYDIRRKCVRLCHATILTALTDTVTVSSENYPCLVSSPGGL